MELKTQIVHLAKTIKAQGPDQQTFPPGTLLSVISKDTDDENVRSMVRFTIIKVTNFPLEAMLNIH